MPCARLACRVTGWLGTIEECSSGALIIAAPAAVVTVSGMRPFLAGYNTRPSRSSRSMDAGVALPAATISAGTGAAYFICIGTTPVQ